MITATEWTLASGNPELRAKLVERETADFLAAGGRIAHAAEISAKRPVTVTTPRE